MITYSSAQAASPARCLRFTVVGDKAKAVTFKSPVCGELARVGERYCPDCRAAMTAPPSPRRQLRPPRPGRASPGDSWVVPTAEEMEEAFG